MESLRNFAILIAALLLAVGTPIYIVAAAPPQGMGYPEDSVPGQRWISGRGGLAVILLSLGNDGAYYSRFLGCLGEYGHARGHWSDEGGKIILSPHYEEGMMRGHLRTLKKMTVEGRELLVRPEDLEGWANDEISISLYAFQVREDAP